ncbi:MAG: S8 family serine peptidase, partial [Planctomycetales bacterium]|nr:S8 family serine peptidase [Planctomycetales bacterium]
MVPYLPRQTEDHKPRRPFRSRIDAKTRSRRVLRLSLERLEPRHLLAGGFGDSSVVDDPPNAAQISWFESYDSVPRIAFEALGDVDQVYSSDFVGPRELARGEWIVQLTESTSRRIRDLSTSDEILDDGVSDFTIISGLGASGLVLVSGESTTAADIQSSLRRNSAVASFSLNSIVRGQQTPNDPEYLAGLLPGLEGIAAPTAWDRSIGNSSVVVGVVDGGIDATHPDLFLNIWLNQGEIPRTLRDQLADIDGDNLITFYDLNNLARSTEEIIVASTGAAATTAEMTTSTPFATGLNAGLVADKNGNGRIDAIDLLEDVRWADGRDGDGNSFFDDLFGVNFRSGSGDPFPSNRPLDELGHGTHVAGTIGAVGDNGFGVTGINWQTSLMSLRILDNNNQSDAAAAIRAINYARWMRDSVSFDEQGRLESGADLRVLNNSWGQPGGFEQAFSSVITELGDAGILFVAASGNGNLLGNGVNNDSTPFFPASYEADNLISVAALDASGGKLAGFSNYGPHSVDIAAPGTGVRSTLPGGRFGPANGTS